MVFNRAMSFRMLLIRRGFSSCIVAPRKRSRNSSSFSSPRRAAISLFSHSRMSSAFISLSSSGPDLLVADHEAGLDRQLRRRQLHGLPGGLLVDALELEHHAARLHHGHPTLGAALSLTHAGLGGLLG